jgi:hypothetical protein
VVSYVQLHPNVWVRVCSDAIGKYKLLFYDGKRGNACGTLQDLRVGCVSLALGCSDNPDVQYMVVGDSCSLHTPGVRLSIC